MSGTAPDDRGRSVPGPSQDVRPAGDGQPADTDSRAGVDSRADGDSRAEAGRPDPGLDDGSPDPRLAAALLGDDGSAVAYGEVLAALATARVFLALSAQVLATEPAGVTGLRQESAAQMSLLSLVSARGARALPAFLDGHQVQRWRPQARPVAVAGPLACRTALDDGAEALLLDPTGRAFAVSGPALRELAAGRVPVSGAALSTRAATIELVAGPPSPPGLLVAIAQALAGEPLRAARLLAGPDGPVLGLVTDLPPAGLAALADRLRLRLGADLPPDGLDVAVVPEHGPGEPVAMPRRILRRR